MRISAPGAPLFSRIPNSMYFFTITIAVVHHLQHLRTNFSTLLALYILPIPSPIIVLLSLGLRCNIQQSGFFFLFIVLFGLYAFLKHKKENNFTCS
jgi:hypothetical protein